MSPDDTTETAQDKDSSTAPAAAPVVKDTPVAPIQPPAEEVDPDGRPQQELEAQLDATGLPQPSPEEAAALNDAGLELRDGAWRPAEQFIIQA